MVWKRYLKKTMAKIFLKLMTHIKSQIQEDQRTPMERICLLNTHAIKYYSAMKCSKLTIVTTASISNKCIL